MKFLAQNVDLTVGVLTFYVQRVLHTKASTLGIIKESLFSLQWLCSIYMLDIFLFFVLCFLKKNSLFSVRILRSFAQIFSQHFARIWASGGNCPPDFLAPTLMHLVRLSVKLEQNKSRIIWKKDRIVIRFHC